mgnify:CR=1 FL=1
MSQVIDPRETRRYVTEHLGLPDNASDAEVTSAMNDLRARAEIRQQAVRDKVNEDALSARRNTRRLTAADCVRISAYFLGFALITRM